METFKKGKERKPGNGRDRLKHKLLKICSVCIDGTCCFGGVDVDLSEALKISQLPLKIKKPWFEYLHRDKNVSSGWALETVVRDGSCVFHREDRKCSIYHVRPYYCAEYPYEGGGLAKNYIDYCCESDERIVQEYVKRRCGMEEKEIGKITHYFGKVSVGIIELTDSLKVGDTIHIKGHSEDFTQTVDSMQIEHAVLTEAKAGDAVGIKVANRVHENDVVYKVVE